MIESYFAYGYFLVITAANSSRTFNTSFAIYVDYSHRRERWDFNSLPNLSQYLMILILYSIETTFQIIPFSSVCTSFHSPNFTTPFGWLQNSTYAGECHAMSNKTIVGNAWKWLDTDRDKLFLACMSTDEIKFGTGSSSVPYHLIIADKNGNQNIYVFNNFILETPGMSYFIRPSYCPA